MDNFWSICLSRFQQELSAQQFNTWIKPLQFETHDGTCRLLAPNRFVLQWVKDRFLDRIKLIAEEVAAHPLEIELGVFNKSESLPEDSGSRIPEASRNIQPSDLNHNSSNMVNTVIASLAKSGQKSNKKPKQTMNPTD